MKNILIICFEILFPIIFSGLLSYKEILGKKSRWYVADAISIIVAYIGAIIGSFGIQNNSIYEMILCESLIIVCIHTICRTIYGKRESRIGSLFAGLCAASLIVALYSILSYGQTAINPDVATATQLADSQWKHKSLFPKSWNYANGEIWILGTNIFVFPFYLLFHNQSLARMLGSVLLVCVTCGFIYLHSKKILGGKSWTISIPVFLLYMFESYDMILYQAAYTGMMLWLTMSTMLAYFSIEHNKKKRFAICLLGLIIMLSMSGPRLVAELSIPLVCTIVIWYVQQKQQKENQDVKQLVKIGGLVCGASAIGMILYKLLCTRLVVHQTAMSRMVLADSLQSIWDNIVRCIINLFWNFGYVGEAELFSPIGIRNMMSVTVGLLFTIVIPILQIRKIREEEPSFVFFFDFVLVHNLIMLIAGAFTGKIEIRYMLTSVYMLILISARYIWKYWIENGVIKYALFGLFGFTTIWYACMMLGFSKDWKVELQNKKQLAQELISRNAIKGYGSCWNSEVYALAVYSDMRLTVGGVSIDDASINANGWLDDNDAYIPVEGKSFLILTEEDKNMLGERLQLICGQEEELFEYGNKFVYIFDHDIVVDFPRGNVMRDGAFLPYEEFYNNNVEYGESYLTIHPGGVIYGPYATIPKGKYKFTVLGQGLEQLDFDVHSNTLSYETDDLQYRECNRSDTSIEVEVELLTDADDVEVRLYNNTQDIVATLEKIEVVNGE